MVNYFEVIFPIKQPKFVAQYFREIHQECSNFKIKSLSFQSREKRWVLLRVPPIKGLTARSGKWRLPHYLVVEKKRKKKKYLPSSSNNLEESCRLRQCRDERSAGRSVHINITQHDHEHGGKHNGNIHTYLHLTSIEHLTHIHHSFTT